MSSSDKSIPGLQYLRGFAACAVVMDHSAAITSEPEFFGGAAHPFLLAGWVGVPIFFVISGFIITTVSLNADFSSRLTMPSFFWRRFARIVPFMWLCIIAYVLVSYLGTRNFDWLMTLRTITLWPLGDLKPNVTWTLRVEFLFYIVFAVTLLAQRRHYWALAIWLISPFIIAAADAIFPGALGVLPEHVEALLRFATTIHNIEFAAGMLLGLLWLARGKFPAIPGGIGLLFTLTLAMVALVWLADYESSPDIGQAIILTLASFAVVYVSVSIRPARGLLGRVGEVLGNASYSIYLIHNLVILIALELSGKVGNPVQPLFLVPLLFLASVVTGVLVHWYVEVPLVDFVRRLKSGPPTGTLRPAPTPAR